MTSGSDPAVRSQASIRELVRPLLIGRRVRIVLLSGTALASAMSEAIVLVAITQIAFTLADGGESIDLALGPVSIGWKVNTAIVVAFVLVLLRGAMQVLNGWQATNLVADYQAEARKEFSEAFLQADCPAGI